MASEKVKSAAKKKAAGKKRNLHTTGFIFWICLILIAAPIAVLGWILLSSAMDTGSPVLGNRYEGDLDPAITKEQMAEVETAVSGLEGIEKANVQMVTATMRIYADVPDDWGIDSVKEKASEIYDTVTGILDPAVYFTQTDGRKMYDIEVHVYNLAENRESDEFVYVIRNKSSSMESPISSVVSEPVDAELAQQLRDDVAAREAAEAERQAAEEAEAAGETEASEGEGEEAPAEEGSEENTEG
jgi:hypothetical protein